MSRPATFILAASFLMSISSCGEEANAMPTTDNPPEDYSPSTGAWGIDVDRNDTMSPSGGYVVEFKNTVVAGKLFSDKFWPVVAGAPYMMSARAYLSAVGGGQTVDLRAYWYQRDQSASATPWTSYFNTTLNNAVTWENIAAVHEAPADAAYVKVRYGKGAGLAYTLYIDELDFVPVGHAFGAFLSADQANVVTGTWTKVNHNAEDFDHGANFAGGAFTVPKPGRYHFSAGLTAEAIGITTDVISALYVNPIGALPAAAVAYGSRNYNAAAAGDKDTMSQVSKILWLYEGDIVEHYGLHNHGANRNFKGDAVGIYTYFTGFEVF